ncbi:MAG: CHAT domain-containing protein [Acidobacteriota bacterium]
MHRSFAARRRGGWSTAPWTLVALLVGAAVYGDGPAPSPDPADPFLRCAEELAADPGGWNACSCYYTVGRDGPRRLAIEHLEALRSDAASGVCAGFYLGRLLLLSGPEARVGLPSAFDLLTEAAEHYRRDGEARGQVYAHLNASHAARRAGSVDGATRQLDLARRAAAAAGDPLLDAQAALQQARFALSRGDDLARIERQLAAIEKESGSLTSPSLWRDLLQARGNVRFLRGRFDEAESFYRRMAGRCIAAGDKYCEATARLNQVIARSAPGRGPGRRGALRELLHDALAAAVAAGQGYAEAEARLRLAMLPEVDGPGDDAPGHDVAGLHRALDIARSIGSRDIEVRATAALAAAILADDPGRASKLAADSLQLALESPLYGSTVHGWMGRLDVAWRTLAFEQAVTYGLEELARLDTIRGRQRAAGERAEVFAAWTEVFYALAGRILENGAQSADVESGAFEAAFDVIERMRARVLLETLQGPGIRGDLGHRGEQPGAVPGDEFAAAAAPPRLAELQRSLGDGEALLSFHLAPREDVYGHFTGGSWLLVLTREARRAYRLPARDVLASRVRVFRGLMESRPGTARSAGRVAARRLHGDLLEVALRDLDHDLPLSSTGARRHLIIIPDGDLFRLPFAALLDAENRPLIAAHQLSVVPSASLWHRWRRASAASPPKTPREPVRLLALAAPDLGADSELRPLPGATREARHAGRLFPGRILTGAEASASALKALEINRFDILHLATHAVVDSFQPEASAVMLAPGGESGRLRPEEISSLQLDGALVVLSACQSADGQVLAGEGPMSLARAFFRAGSPTVLASLWPQRDDDAASLVTHFHRSLARGDTVAAALAEAQRHGVEGGEPPAAWAGFMVFGDGQRTYPSDRRAVRRLGWASLALTALVLLGSWGAWARFSR